MESPKKTRSSLLSLRAISRSAPKPNILNDASPVLPIPKTTTSALAMDFIHEVDIKDPHCSWATLVTEKWPRQRA